MPFAERNAEMLAGVEFSVWAIHTSVMPRATQSRISLRYGLSVAFCCVVTVRECIRWSRRRSPGPSSMVPATVGNADSVSGANSL